VGRFLVWIYKVVATAGIWGKKEIGGVATEDVEE
jgi:hypothetical protein